MWLYLHDASVMILVSFVDLKSTIVQPFESSPNSRQGSKLAAIATPLGWSLEGLSQTNDSLHSLFPPLIVFSGALHARSSASAVKLLHSGEGIFVSCHWGVLSIPLPPKFCPFCLPSPQSRAILQRKPIFYFLIASSRKGWSHFKKLTIFSNRTQAFCYFHSHTSKSDRHGKLGWVSIANPSRLMSNPFLRVRFALWGG